MTRRQMLEAEIRNLTLETQAIWDRANRERGGDLSRRDAGRVNELQGQLEQLKAELANPTYSLDFDPREVQGTPRLHALQRDDSPVLLRPEQRMLDWLAQHRGLGDVDPHEPFSFGRMVRGMVTGRWESAERERRALVEGTAASGGYLIPERLAARLIDRVRNAARVFQAGVTTVPMTVDELNFARLTGGANPAPTWKNEGAAIAESDMTFDRVKLQARTLPILVKMSRELFDDLSPEAADLIEGEIAASLALELDRAVLRGSGTAPEPKGIRNQTGVNIQSLGTNGAQLVGYDDFATAIGTVRTNNGEPNAAIIAARTQTFLDKYKDSTGQPVQPPASVRDLRFLVSNQIPTNLSHGSANDTSEAYVGVWSDVLVGLRTDVRVAIKVLEERFADTLQVGLLAYLRADVAMAHAERFVVITGIKP